jgi:acetyl esterase/lipase
MAVYGPYRSDWVIDDVQVAALNGGNYRNDSATYNTSYLDFANTSATTSPSNLFSSCGGIIIPLPYELKGISPEDIDSAYFKLTATQNSTANFSATSFGFKLVKSPIDTFPVSRQNNTSIYNPYYLYNTSFSSVTPITGNFGGTTWTAGQQKNTPDLLSHLQDILDEPNLIFGVTPIMLLWRGASGTTTDQVRVHSRSSTTASARPAFYFESTDDNLVASNMNDPSGSFTTTFSTAVISDTQASPVATGKILEVRCENITYSPPQYLYTGVATTGRSTAASPVRVANPFINEAAVFTGDGSKIIFGNNPRASAIPQYERREDIGGMRFQYWAGQNLYAAWNFKTWPSSVTTSLDEFSAKFYWMAYGERSSGLYEGIVAPTSYIHGSSGAVPSGIIGPLFQPQPVVSFRENGVTKFKIRLEGYRFYVSGNYWTALQPYIANSSNQALTTISGSNSDRVLNNVTWRFEVQVQQEEPKVTVKIYNWDSEIPSFTLEANPDDVSCDDIMFGDDAAKDHYHPSMFINDIEVHNNYDMSGTVGKPYQIPEPRWNKIQEGVEVSLSQEGTLAGASVEPVLLTDFDREVVFDSYTTTTISYDGPSRGYRNLDLHVPDGTPPAGGWPTVVWSHGGFFVSGDKYDLPEGFKKYLLMNGFAVATIEYVLGTALIGAPNLAGFDIGIFPIQKPVWPNDGSGEFPSFLIDFKKAAKYLQTNSSTYDLNPNKFIASGFSAGGYVALGAATTKDLDDFNGYNLTVTNTTYGGSGSESDPDFVGAYVFCAPISIQAIWDYDPTHPYYGFIFEDLPDNPANRQGRLRTTARAFMGDTYNSNPDFTGTSIAEFVAENSANCPPIGYSQGASDYLVHWEHADLLEEQCQTSGIVFDKHVDPTYHDFVNVQFGKGHLLNFLRSVI